MFRIIAIISKANLAVIAVILGAVLFTSPAWAARAIYGEWESDSEQGYVFTSIEAPMTAVIDRKHVLIWATASYLYYTFGHGFNETDVTAPGLAVGLAWRDSEARLTWTIGAGYEARRSEFKPTFGVEYAETEKGLKLQGGIIYRPSWRTTLKGFLSYSDADEYRWLRAGFSRRVSSFDCCGLKALALGGDASFQDNGTIKTRQYGAVVELITVSEATAIELRFGVSKLEFPFEFEDRRSYMSIGAYQAF